MQGSAVRRCRCWPTGCRSPQPPLMLRHGYYCDDRCKLWLCIYMDRGVPAVNVDRPYRDGAGHITIDDRAAAARAARHVLELGHRDFAVVAAPLRPDGYAGFA